MKKTDCDQEMPRYDSTNNIGRREFRRGQEFGFQIAGSADGFKRNNNRLLLLTLL